MLIADVNAGVVFCFVTTRLIRSQLWLITGSWMKCWAWMIFWSFCYWWDCELSGLERFVWLNELELKGNRSLRRYGCAGRLEFGSEAFGIWLWGSWSGSRGQLFGLRWFSRFTDGKCRYRGQCILMLGVVQSWRRKCSVRVDELVHYGNQLVRRTEVLILRQGSYEGARERARWRQERRRPGQVRGRRERKG